MSGAETATTTGGEKPTPEVTPETGTPPATTPVAPAETATTEPETGTESTTLPDDHPVVQALKKANAEAAAARAKVKEFEDKDKSELELAQQTVKETADKLAKTELENARLAAGVEFGLSPEDLKLLGDGPAEGFRDRAKALADRLKGVKPVIDPDPNVGENAPPAGSIDEQIAAAQKAGDVAKVISLQNQKLNPAN